jgi:hypothetical protein
VLLTGFLCCETLFAGEQSAAFTGAGSLRHSRPGHTVLLKMVWTGPLHGAVNQLQEQLPENWQVHHPI